MHDLESRLRAYGTTLDDAADAAASARIDDSPVIRLQSDDGPPRGLLLPAAAVVLFALGAVAVLVATFAGGSTGAPDGPQASPAAGVTVPDLQGLHGTEARSVLSEVGLQAHVVEVAADRGPAGTVVGQDPHAGATVDPDSPVTIEVAAADPVPGEARSYLAPLDGYDVDDTVDVGDIEASLDHRVPYLDVARRSVLDDDGYHLARITVVTLQPGTDGVELYLQHHFGDAPREAVDADLSLLRIPTQAHDALVWTGPDVVVTFERGQDVTDDWLVELAAHSLMHRIRGDGIPEPPSSP